MSLHPAPGRIAAVEPPVEDGTLWLPPTAAGQAGDLERALVTEVGSAVDLDVQPGDVVYFHRGHFAKIEDTMFIAGDCVLAYDRKDS